jgi:hypothetical protein
MNNTDKELSYRFLRNLHTSEDLIESFSKTIYEARRRRFSVKAVLLEKEMSEEQEFGYSDIPFKASPSSSLARIVFEKRIAEKIYLIDLSREIANRDPDAIKIKFFEDKLTNKPISETSFTIDHADQYIKYVSDISLAFAPLREALAVLEMDPRKANLIFESKRTDFTNLERNPVSVWVTDDSALFDAGLELFKINHQGLVLSPQITGEAAELTAEGILKILNKNIELDPDLVMDYFCSGQALAVDGFQFKILSPSERIIKKKEMDAVLELDQIIKLGALPVDIDRLELETPSGLFVGRGLILLQPPKASYLELREEDMDGELTHVGLFPIPQTYATRTFQSCYKAYCQQYNLNGNK